MNNISILIVDLAKQNRFKYLLDTDDDIHEDGATCRNGTSLSSGVCVIVLIVGNNVTILELEQE